MDGNLRGMTETIGERLPETRLPRFKQILITIVVFNANTLPKTIVLSCAVVVCYRVRFGLCVLLTLQHWTDVCVLCMTTSKTKSAIAYYLNRLKKLPFSLST
ncbi:hypothetical protein NP493_1284g00027 [Ridgeia piscesae]|uniref:Uncharacterized protein n=1 Tax=Ridgeia piscesae TaxID=27915 RepID=A0AAD9K918_RIDPI|nr:hypothetical protein NP493_1284g00027 [Ridgeia piscesae]